MSAALAAKGGAHSYRVPVVRNVSTYTGIDRHTEHVRVRANNAVDAALRARWVTGAQVALLPERIEPRRVQTSAVEAA